MDATEFMSGLGTIIIIASVVIAALTSLLLLVVSIKPDFMNNWKTPGESGKADVKTTHAHSGHNE
ncbi:hypothetical protein [Tomitella cavernea]|uniref:Uncharacterized protein n=1 Tax=Tomitella cavernea TaxID=1387982 RepID=A0ABP9CZX0_9ACTN|nr:hypothetical protein [Tomitella cavernea]